MKGKYIVLIMLVVSLLAIWFAFFLLDVYTPDENENENAAEVVAHIK